MQTPKSVLHNSFKIRSKNENFFSLSNKGIDYSASNIGRPGNPDEGNCNDSKIQDRFKFDNL